MSSIIRVDKSRSSSGLVASNRKVMSDALALLGKEGTHPAKRLQQRPGSLATAPIDLMRICAVHSKVYLSRYLDHENGRIVYGGPIKRVELVRDQYSEHALNTVEIPTPAFAEETCPWCGAVGYAAVLCGNCKREICYGLTDSKGLFTCCCGYTARLREQSRPMRGVRPTLGHGIRGT